MAKLQALVDLQGEIIAAQLDEQAGDDETPSATLLPSKGQYAVTIEVPDEVLNLPGPDLHRFLSNVRISWPAEVQLPKFEIVRKDHSEGAS